MAFGGFLNLRKCLRRMNGAQERLHKLAAMPLILIDFSPYMPVEVTPGLTPKNARLPNG
jgi:hypothetical protein